MEILIGLVLCFLAGLVPAAIYSTFVNWLDQHEQEPWWLLALAFAWGGLPAIIGAVVAQVLLDIPTTWVLTSDSIAYEVVGGSIWAPATEEVAKGIGVLLIILIARRELDNVLDGIIYGAMAGLGFAFTENLLYFGGALAEDGWGSWMIVVLLRTIPFGLNHAFFTGLTGAGLALASLSRSWPIKTAALPGGLLAGMFFHGLHNLGATLAVESCTSLCVTTLANWGGIILLGVVIRLIWQQERAWMAAQLPGEVSDEVYRLVTSWRRWQGAGLEALLRGDLSGWRRLDRLRATAAELAFKKQQLAEAGPSIELGREVERYRLRLAELASRPLSGTG